MKKLFMLILLLLLYSCSLPSNRRFEKIHSESHSIFTTYKIILDKETGVKYLIADVNFGGVIIILQEAPNK